MRLSWLLAVLAITGACKRDEAPGRGTCVRKNATFPTISCSVNAMKDGCMGEFFAEPPDAGVTRCEGLGARHLGATAREDELRRRDLKKQLAGGALVIFMDKSRDYDNPVMQ